MTQQNRLDGLLASLSAECEWGHYGNFTRYVQDMRECLQSDRTVRQIVASFTPQAVDLLFQEAPAAVASRDGKGNTLLTAVRHADMFAVLERWGAPINAVNQQGETALMVLARNEQPWSMMQGLLGLKPDVHLRDHQGMTALDHALGAEVIHFDVVLALVQEGADYDPFSERVAMALQQGKQLEVNAALLALNETQDFFGIFAKEAEALKNYHAFQQHVEGQRVREGSMQRGLDAPLKLDDRALSLRPPRRPAPPKSGV